MKPSDIILSIIVFAATVWILLNLVAWIHLLFWRLLIGIGTECYFIDFQNKKFSGKITDIQKPIAGTLRRTYFLFRGKNELAVAWVPAKSLYFPKYWGNYDKDTTSTG